MNEWWCKRCKRLVGLVLSDDQGTWHAKDGKYGSHMQCRGPLEHRGDAYAQPRLPGIEPESVTQGELL